MQWKENLPEQCPPSNTVKPNNETYFRLAESNPVSEKDFDSHRKLFPTKIFNTTECIAHSISIFDKIDSIKNLKLLPNHKDKFIAEICLTANDGVVLQTGKDKSHFSYWVSNNFDYSISEIIE